MTNVVQRLWVKNESLLIMTKGFSYWWWKKKKQHKKKILCLKLYTGIEWKLYAIPAKWPILLLENPSDWNVLQSKLLQNFFALLDTQPKVIFSLSLCASF